MTFSFPRFFRFAFSLGLLLSALSVAAQAPDGRVADPNNHLWLVYNGTFRLSERWGYYTEAQVRLAEMGRRTQQNFVRTAVDFHLNKAIMLSAGYGFADTHRYGDYPAAERFPEHRIYQQVLLRDEAGRVQLQHRYRLEQRWIRRPLQENFTYQNRARYMARLAIPLLGPDLTPRMPYVVLADEVFVNFGKNVAKNIFDQNRLYAAFGYKASPAVNLEIGYLNQLVQQGNGRVWEHNHTLQLGVYLNLDMRRNSSTTPDLPAPVEAAPR